jgi:hypothetical protein
MKELPVAARVYVTAVIAVGLALFLVCLPQVHFDQPFLFAGLFILSLLSTALKVLLPLTAGGSTMSVSYAVDFAGLLLLGPHDTMLIVAAGALSQCSLNSKERNPLYRTLFSVAALVITVQAAGLAARLLGGTSSSMSLLALARPHLEFATTNLV